MQRPGIGVGIDRHRRNPHFSRGANDAARDLAAIGDQDFGEHAASSLSPSFNRQYARASSLGQSCPAGGHRCGALDEPFDPRDAVGQGEKAIGDGLRIRRRRSITGLKELHANLKSENLLDSSDCVID